MADFEVTGDNIPSVRPGKATEDYLDFILRHLYFAEAVFLSLIAVLPHLLIRLAELPVSAAQFFGVSMAILTGAVLQVAREIETTRIWRHYDGFLRKGRIRGQSSRRTGAGPSGFNGQGSV